MGSSKVIWTAGISLIIGIFSMGIKEAEKMSLQSRVDHANVVQPEELAKAAVQMALDDLGSYHPSYVGTFYQQYFRTLQSQYVKAVGGDSVWYQITRDGSYSTATVVVLAKSNGYSSTVSANLSKVANPVITDWGWLYGTNIYRGRWKVLTMYAE